MVSQAFFPQRPDATPIIYGYTEPDNRELQGMIKVGYTTRPLEARMREHYPTLKPGKQPYQIVFQASALRSDGTVFMDHEIHRKLEQYGNKRLRSADGKKTEWVKCTVKELRAAWVAVRDRTDNEELRTQNFRMRPEQREAVDKTLQYYKTIRNEDPKRIPKFLWNAKMRFGKTFATYQLAKHMGARRVLVLTFKPAVQSAWHDDLMSHVDFEGWQFVSRNGMTFAEADESRPIVCFGSFQDFMGRDTNTGGIKPRNEWVHHTQWDLVVFDEYHFGAWNENSKNLFAQNEEDEMNTDEDPILTVDKVCTGKADDYDETSLPITTRHYLFLSGTPFRALTSGEFIEEQIFNWTYTDEQQAKDNWDKAPSPYPNPYASLPRMVLMTYRMPEEIIDLARGGEFNSFDLNAFFEAKGEGDQAEFVMKDKVQRWLNLIRGADMPTVHDDLLLGDKNPAMPYSDTRLLQVLNHTIWYLPRVNSCFAMRNLLQEKQNVFFQDYTINVAAGTEAGVGIEALRRVQETMEDPLHSKTITLTCGKLTTGVTVKPWTAIFMLTNMKSPETYFQAAFRVQSPWTIKDDDGKETIIKKECYVFDFALDRSLRMISDYSCRLSTEDNNPENKVSQFIDFLPVLAYDGSAMKPIDASEILDIAMAGTSATLLARRWESALLVNVDNETLSRILNNEEALDALMHIEGFRSLNQDIETIINKSEAVRRAKREAAENDRTLSNKEKKELSEEEKNYRKKRKAIQEKLIKFATRIPIFMYLTDYREQTLKDVITQIEPDLFFKVTGLTVHDFELLVSLGVFNNALMNDAIYKFRRYEDASLSYTGINKHQGERIGLFDTSITEPEFLDAAQQDSMIAPTGLDKRRNTEHISPDQIISVLEDKNLSFIDKRSSDGCLWVFGDESIAGDMQEFEDRGVIFKYSEKGGRVTKKKPGWWTK